jgi:hypothetical protein
MNASLEGRKWSHLKGKYIGVMSILRLVNSLFLAMPTDLYTKIYNFLSSAEEEDITAGSVIYQGIEENPWIT